MVFEQTRRSASYVGWLIACLALAALAAFLLFAPTYELKRAAALTSGNVEKASARLDACLNTNERTDRYGRVRNGPDEWLAEFRTEDEPDRPEDATCHGTFNPSGKGAVLEKWDGATVTTSRWDGSVVAAELPDGTVVRDAHVGWYGTLNRWAAGVGVLGVALVLAWSTLGFGKRVGLAGGALLVAAVLLAVHLRSLSIGLFLDVFVVLGVVMNLALWRPWKRRVPS